MRKTPPRPVEPRWPVVLAVAVGLAVMAALPPRIQVAPAWFAYSLGVAVLVPTAAVGLSSAKKGWLQVERAVILVFFVVAACGGVVNLANLVDAIVHRSGQVTGVQLLASSIGVWVANVIAFSLFYWQLDRGGPEARAAGTSPKPDWLFPQEGAPGEDVSAGWRPTFVDYLFLGFNTATAFSPTDALPLTARAKLLMMLESSISLATIVVTAARAINILGG